MAEIVRSEHISSEPVNAECAKTKSAGAGQMIAQMNTTALAYMGDAVWEVFVRAHLIDEGMTHVDDLHKKAIKYVSAGAQEKILKHLMDGFLTDDEISLVKRARNHKLAASKKNSKKNSMTDKYATAFEALIGYLHLSGSDERLEEVVEKSFDFVEKY